MFDKLFNGDNEETEKGFYLIRTHNDKEKQFCPYCNADREFLFDRCVVCHNN